MNPPARPIRATPLTFVLPLLLSLAVLPACARRPDVRVVDADATFSLDEAEAAARAMDASRYTAVAVEDAPRLRREALVELRRHERGREIADLLTEQFPTVTLAVPLYVERAAVDGRDAWIVVEAWGSESGKLDRRRLWVFDARTAEVVASSSFQ